ncbi:MAG: succinate--CoA ligase subunit beta, partial [Puniceicoccales bacterium]|nr:succinate--CoA ligase subunit beta [Puniceicoccales bacterium]
MKSHEYQAKQLLASYGVPVERGVVVWDADKADKALHMLGRRPRYVVKAQVHSGGRGKGHFADGFPGGGVQMAKSPEEVERLLRGMLHNRLITAQNAPKGNLVTAVYIAEAIDMVQQFYVAVFIDRKRQQPLILVSKDGGMDIESLAETNPEKFFREYVSTTYGLEEYQVRRIAFWLGIK